MVGFIFLNRCCPAALISCRAHGEDQGCITQGGCISVGMEQALGCHQASSQGMIVPFWADACLISFLKHLRLSLKQSPGYPCYHYEEIRNKFLIQRLVRHRHCCPEKL